MKKSIVIAEKDNIAAVLEDGKVTEFFVNKGDVFLNDIFLATVDNFLPSIEAAFVNIGYDKMGFLHADDVSGKGNLKSKLSPKQKIMVQVVKEPTGHKGPRVTTEISIPGRFLVLMPEEAGINVSRKITSSKERARLKSVVSLVKPVGIGVIVRTEAEGQSDRDIQEDLELLLEKWNTVISAAETREAPSLLYRDRDLLYRVIREACTEDTDEIIVDTPFAMQRTSQILQNWNMSKNINLSVYKGTEPLLQSSGIIREIKAALQTKVMLPSGGYLFIQTTEALTVVDVNSGKFVSSATQDETILKTNIEAVHEIARQLRLRNIGGMIIIDFIDMSNRNDKLAIMEEFELALENDKAKPQIGQLSDLGLVELTRHRQGQALSEVFAKKCPHCGGSGILFEEIKPADGELKTKPIKQKVSSRPNNFRQNSENVPSENIENVTETVTENNSSEETENKEKNNFKQFKQNRFNKKNRFNKFNKNERKEQNKPDETPAVPVVNVEVKTEKPEPKEEISVTKVSEKTETPEITEEKKVPKKRGRKPKVKEQAAVETPVETEAKPEPKKRGRKPKAKAVAVNV